MIDEIKKNNKMIVMKNIFSIGFLLAITVAFSSCLKDTPVVGPDAPGAVSHIIEFLNPTTIGSNTSSTVPIYSFAYDIVPSSEVKIEVSYSGKTPAPNDITVHVELDPTLIETANEEQEDDPDMILMPEDLYTMSSTDLVIKKGEKTASFTITFTPDQFDFSDSYAVPLRIKSVDGTDAPISGNFGAILLNVGAKNQWDGVYKVDGDMNVDANGVYEGVYPTECALITTNANTNLYYQWEVDYPNILVANITTGGLANLGANPSFVFDENGGVTVVYNGANIGSGTYDFDAKVMKVTYAIGTRWHMDETWKYDEPR